LNGLIIAVVLLLTVLLVLAVGIGFSYLAANAVFRIVVHRPEERATASLTTAEAGGGD
jgi:hypothetical protein